MAAVRIHDRAIKEHPVEPGLHRLTHQLEGPFAPPGVDAECGAGAVQRIDPAILLPIGHDLEPVEMPLAELEGVPVHVEI